MIDSPAHAAYVRRLVSGSPEEIAIFNHARAMSEALLKVRPLGGSEMFSKVGEEYFADPVKCGEEIDRLRADLHEARKAEVLLVKRNAALLAFVEQMARLTTLDDEFDAADEEGVKLRAQYDDVSDYQSDLGDERLCGEFEAFQDMIRAARELLA